MRIGDIVPKRFSTRLVVMTLVSGLIPIIIFGLLFNTLGRRFATETNLAIETGQHQLMARGETVLRQMAEKHIRQKALDVALQLDLYLQAHPEKSVKDFQQDPDFRTLAVQPVGETGYTAVQETHTAINRFHRSPKIENMKLQVLSDKLPGFWSIMEASLGARHASGYYRWQEADGSFRDKFMYIAPLHERTGDGVRLGVAATTYIDEFTRPMVAAQNIFRDTTLQLRTTVDGLILSSKKIGFTSMGLGIILVLVVAYWIGTYFSQAITQLRESTIAVNQGNFDVHLEPAMSGEVGELTQDFNDMVAQLAATTVSKDLLEAREKELREINARLMQQISERQETEYALQKSEEKFRTVFMAAPVGIAIARPDGRFLTANESFCQMLGYTEEEISGMSFLDITYPEDRWETQQLAGEVWEGTSNSYQTDKRYVRKDGQVIWATVRANVVRDGNGNLQYWLGLVEDVSERKEAKEEKKRMQTQLRQAQKMEAIGTLAGGVAHDFNNLLQAVQGFAELLLLRKKEGEPDYRELQEIHRAAKRGGELTRQLLTFSRKVESRRHPLDLNQEVTDVGKLLERTIPKMIKIELRLADDLRVINGDSGQIEQIIMNLAVNATDAMPEGGKLTISSENETLDELYARTHVGVKPGDYVILSISDTGHGMSQTILGQIFDPFFTTKELGRGTGLGLAMVYGIVKSHEGYITCYSEIGKGTTFKIYLPAMEEVTEKARAPKFEFLVRGGSETILLVDDDESIRDLGEQILTDSGYAVLTAPDGESALRFYQQKKDEIDLIILDLIMPGIGGRRCLNGLLKLDPQMNILVSSGYYMDDRTREVIKAGAKGFVSKPYDLTQMLEVVRQVLDEASDKTRVEIQPSKGSSYSQNFSPDVS